VQVRRFRSAAQCIALLLYALCAAAHPAQAANSPAAEDLSPCGLQAGTLTTVLTPDNNTDFVVFGLYSAGGDEVARQFIPMYNPDASAELMITPIGFGGAIATAKCLADSTLHRCPDPSWQLDEGLGISLAGLVIGPDFLVASVNGRYKRPSNTAQLAIDGGLAGFQLDKDPVRWSSFFNNATQVSQAFFGLSGGQHTLVIGSRDPSSGAIVPQDRLCFRT
jgi:hypothetical protein